MLNTMKKPYKIALCTAILFLIAYYVISPYMAMQRLYDGVMQANADVIETHVDFPSLRESLKEQANAYLATRMPRGQDGRTGIFGAAGMVLMPAVVQSLVDAYVTPTGMRQILDRAVIKVDGTEITSAQDPAKKEPRQLKREDIDYAFFENPDTFRIEARNMVFILRLKDWKWKLTDARLPPEFFSRNAKKLPQENTPAPDAVLP
jgi:hypothetical protein